MQGRKLIVATYLIGALPFGRAMYVSPSFIFDGETAPQSFLMAAPGLSISPKTMPDGLYGAAYKDQNLKVTGGTGAYSFAVSGGSLPPGVSLSGGGTLSGTPTAAGTYSFTVTAANQYTRSVSQDYKLVVAQAPLTITANNAAFTYGGAMPALTASYSGFVNGDNDSLLTTPPIITTTAAPSSPIGAYPITVSGAMDPNYSFVYNSGTLNINPATLTVTANAQTKEYGAADPAFIYTASGFVNGDNTGIFTGGLSRTPGENVGSYPITMGSLSAGANYTIGYTGNNLTITTASQQITWTQSLLVGCNSTTKLQLTATASSGLPVTYSVADPSIATVSGNILTLLHLGTTVITALQAGDVNHAAAQPVTDTVFYQSTSLIRQHWNDVIIFDNSSGGFVQWQWFKNGQAIPGATGPYYSETPSLNGQYYVIATNAASQQIQSCTLTITGDTAVSAGIRIYPNPVNAGAAVTVTSSYTASILQGAILQVIDINGKVRQQITSVQPSMQVTMPSDPGIYIINLLLANGQKASTNALVN